MEEYGIDQGFVSVVHALTVRHMLLKPYNDCSAGHFVYLCKAEGILARPRVESPRFTQDA